MDTNEPILTEGNGKTVAILSYITLIGWLIAYFAMYKDRKTSLGAYHLKQALYLFLVMFVIYIVLDILLSVTGALALVYLSYILNIVYLLLSIIGIINAANGVEKPLPLIGAKAETMFNWI